MEGNRALTTNDRRNFNGLPCAEGKHGQEERKTGGALELQTEKRTDRRAPCSAEENQIKNGAQKRSWPANQTCARSRKILEWESVDAETQGQRESSTAHVRATHSHTCAEQRRKKNSIPRTNNTLRNKPCSAHSGAAPVADKKFQRQDQSELQESGEEKRKPRSIAAA
jgi:hypothetical protein